MEKWKSIQLSKEEEEGVIVADEEVCAEEGFQRSLAGKLWTESNFNARAFKSTMVNAWKLKNPVETQDLSKNLFLFKFATKRDLEYVLRNGPWSFDRYLLVLKRISGEEQPSDLNMHYGSFWVRIYELPLILRSETMAKKLGSILGEYEEMDSREAFKNGRFLRVKVTLNLKDPLKRGTIVKFKEKNLRVHFKYERLPTFCFVCGRMGHQMKDCEALEEFTEEGFDEIEEQDLSYGQWLRASPLPKMSEESRKKDSSSGNCSKNLFSVSSSHSRCDMKEKSTADNAEMIQIHEKEEEPAAASGEAERVSKGKKMVDVEKVAESLGAVILSSTEQGGTGLSKEKGTQQKKWSRKKVGKKLAGDQNAKKAFEATKRQLVDVMITEGPIERIGASGKKRRQSSEADDLPEVVLEDQHRLPQ
ncbi:uncharacterized protein LOC131625473 [Vicia villosa]|uniref:uncharacterized protein LOC131625473 n=1 Tax=Vicia villosa TaxID=3911 RepID=UPI00273B537A|nr:uncharacterized protein LOC131625473 [Vicia villosa]